ncbi:MAG: bifunctional indole-3-glycerol-phosphate synthase TrpC/phosphoribosylanthranilate isomerase TrpF, partial [Sphingomicrobium sp.]
MIEPPGILGQIIAAKRLELRQRFDGVSLDALRSRAAPTRRSLATAIARLGARFILEIKKASPSQGIIRHGADVDVLARGYAPVADVLSVLTDSAFFGGSLEDLAAAQRNFAGPILAKDFCIDLRQVAEARIAGADAMLVMLSVLDDGEARAMIREARRFGMDALVEVHDEGEMRRALALGAPLIGINNRDLRDLSVDLRTTERLAPLATGRLLVSESGIRSRGDIERLSPRVSGFLVGSSLMRASDPGQAARELVFGRVKLCGLNRTEDVAAGSAAAFAGLVFVPGSPRHITPEAGMPLADQARRSGMLPVGVFRDAPPRAVGDIATRLNLHAVQLHGTEGEDYVRALRRMVPRACEIWRAVSVGREPLQASGVDRLLFDNENGGSGRAFDWKRVRGYPDIGRSLIAGGIGLHNAQAASALGAHAIDVGSAMDSRPGHKSPARIRQLFEALRPRAREDLAQC